MRKKKNIVLQNVLIEDYAAEGKSLARVDGKVIFAEGAVPGDVVDIRLRRNKKDWAEGTVIQIHSFSNDRVVPFCRHFGVCGGCQWQMLPYEKQLYYKQKQVEEALKRIGKVELPGIMPILGADETRYYRNKLEYTFGTKEFLPHAEFEKNKNQNESSSNGVPIFGQLNETSVLGFHAKGFFDKIVDIETCYLQAEPTNAIRLAVRQFAKQNNFSFYDINEHHGLMRTMQVR
ncbi:MAG: TRAM domain-containing protein, partial [Bacteroidota bacterium]|nr:TRAM domain-containing protein [Bacteroidota bacterium]